MSDSGRTIGDQSPPQPYHVGGPPRHMSALIPPMLALEGELAVVLANLLKPTTTAQRLAVAVLRGDEGAAAAALVDWLQEHGPA